MFDIPVIYVRFCC